jgi:ABC-type transport system involved in cytochrome c biogenesis permease component
MRILSMVAMTSVILSPIGTLLGLMFQIEREFLFPLIFLPIATPVVLGAYSFGLQDGQNWLWILATFLVGSIFICSLIFHFFFDDLTT